MQEDAGNKLLMTTVAEKQRYAVEWFLTGATVVGFIWLFSSHWEMAKHALSSRALWITIGIGGVIKAFTSSRGSRPS
jgi:hypothetical protein